MWPTIRDGEKVYVEKSGIEVGDIVAYWDDNRIIVHRIVALDATSFIAKGDNMPDDDPQFPISRIIGKVRMNYEFRS